MYRIIFIGLIVSFTSCSETIDHQNEINSGTIQLDTLYLASDMETRLKFNHDTLTEDRLIPRNTWVTMKVEGKGAIVEILEHSNLFFESDDTNFQIKKIANDEFKIFVDNTYSGYLPPHGGECLTIYSIIQPKEGYIFKFAWIDKAIIYPEKTRVLTHYEPLEPVEKGE